METSSQEKSVQPAAEAEHVEVAAPVETAPAGQPAGAAGGGPVPDSGATSDDEVRRLEAEVGRMHDQYLRQVAEFQTYRRRVAQTREEEVFAARSATVLPLLDVVDDLDRSLEAFDENEGDGSSQALRAGVELVRRKFDEVLAGLGVSAIDALGTPFDENLHEAMMQRPAADGEAPGTVVGEVQKGYRLGERVLRHARVIVAAEAA